MSMAVNHTCLLADIVCSQEDFEDQWTNIDWEKEIKDIPLQDPIFFEENDDLDWCINWADAHLI
jgi:hypothetical protein